MPGMQVKSENRSLTYPRYIQGEIAPLGRPAGYQGSPGRGLDKRIDVFFSDERC